MKFSLVCLVVLGAVTMAKADTATLSSNMDAQVKVLSESLEGLSKKFEEMSGYKTDFDKEKFSKLVNTVVEEFKKFGAKFEKEGKVVPDELKKKYEEVVKNVQEGIKNLSSPEVQDKTKKVQDTFQNSVKKVGDAVIDLTKSLGFNIPPTMKNNLDEMVGEYNKITKTVQEKMQKMLEGVQEELKKKKN